jgi:hypothetical protein
VYVQEKDPETGLHQVLISIKIPQKTLDEVATEIGLEASLTYPFAAHFVKAKFESKFQKFFNMFDATEKVELIVTFLEREIDFAYFE